MKKLLALVLALVMTLSLCITSNAAFDGEEYDYDEAVEVMAMVGVFKGDENGKFNGKTELTREQAAKLIAYLDLGEKVAEALPAVKVFNDVEATRWSAKYVAYCADAGYLAGVGNGNFDPAGKLTGYAFGKMLLCVLGYDATIEGFTGANWQIAVAKLMQSNDIAKSVVDAASATLTREAAAQYCLNALKATMVGYDSKGTSIKINGTEIATGASSADPAKSARPGADLKTYLYNGNLTCASADDAMNNPATRWTYRQTGKPAEYVYAADESILSYTAKVTKSATVKNDIKDLGYNVADGVAVYEDGADTAARIVNADDYYTVTEDSKLVKFYADGDKNINKIVCVDEHIAKLTTGDIVKANKTTGVPRYLNISGRKYVTDAFEKNDHVLYTYAVNGDNTVDSTSKAGDGNIQSIALAKSVEGKVTAYSTSSITVDGVKYTTNHALTVGTPSFTNTYTFYLDSCGNIIDYEAKSTAASTDFAYVTKVQSTNNASDISKAAERTAYAQVILPDGTKKTVSLEIKKDGDGYYFMKPDTLGAVAKTEVTTVGAANINNWFAYTVNTDGAYVLEAISSDYAHVVTNALTLNKNEAQAIDTNYFTNADMTVVMIDGDNVATTSTGYKTSNTTLDISANKILVVYDKTTGVNKNITAIYAVAQATQTTSVTYAYAVEQGANVKNATEWVFAINGEQVTKAISAGTVSANTIYTLTSSTSVDGAYEAAPATLSNTGATVTFVTGNQFVVGGTTYTMADDVAIYDVDTTGDDEAPVLGAAIDEIVAGDTISFVVSNDKVTKIWVTNHAEA